MQLPDATVDEVLTAAGIGADDVGIVFLTGGTSKIPLIRKLFADRFGDRIADQNTFTSVSEGLGVETRARFG